MSRKKFKDSRGGHARLYWSLLDSAAYIALSTTARALYVDLKRKQGANNNGNVECTLSTMRARGWTAPNTLFNALQELVAVGLLVMTRQGGVANGKKSCSLYRFTDEPCFEFPKLEVPASTATFDYVQFQNLAQARAAIDNMKEAKRLKAAARKAQRTLNGKKKRKLQKLYRANTETVSKRRIINTEIERERPPAIQKLKQAKAL